MIAELRNMRSLRLIFRLLAVLIVPLVPFLAFGWYLEPQMERLLEASREWPILVGFLAIFLLAIDIFLPVPSSFVCTTAGQILGIPLGTLLCMVGLQAGAWLGWSLGRRFGTGWIERSCDKESRQMGSDVIERWGAWAILISRPIPLVAEAVVLLLGTHPGSFRRWLPSLVLGNLSIALAWCSLGQLYPAKHAGIAGIISIALPTALLVIVQWLHRTKRSGSDGTSKSKIGS